MNQRQRSGHRKPICRLLPMTALMMVTMMALLVSSVNASQALSFTIEPQDVVVPEGDSVLLRCSGAAQMSAKHSKVAPVIRWRGPDGLDLNFVGETCRTQLKNGSLYISSVEQNRGLTGSYQCLLTVDEIGTIVSRSAVVSIANLPDLNQDFMEMYLLAGQTAYFRCMLGDMQTGIKHSVQWYKDDLPLRLDEMRMVVLPNGALEIDEVSAADRGMYHCNVTAGNVVRLSSKTNLNLKKAADGGGDEQQMAPSFLVGPSPKTVREGETATLDCVANGVPKPEIKWLRNGEELDLKDLDSRFSIIGTGSLQISSVEDIDSGNYQCRASNPVDSLDAQATVLVQVPPKFIQSPKDKLGHEKDELELECAIRGKPTPLVQWLKNGDVITPNEYMQLVSGHNLRILGLLQSDAGMFQCVGTNPAGSVQAGARLRIVQPGKLRKNKQQSQRTKSLQSNQFGGKRRKSNGMRIKSAGGPFYDESFETGPFGGNDTQDGGGDLLLPLPKGKPKKYASTEKALNDRNYGDLSPNLSNYDDDYDDKVSQETFETPKRQNDDEDKLEMGKLHSGHGVPVLDSGLLQRLPNAPGDLVATIVKPRFVTLSWMEPTKNPTEIVSYTVYYKIANNEREQKIITKSHDEQQVNIQNLMPGKKYQFRVVANTNFGPSESSQILEVTTQPEENIAGPPRSVEGYARSHKEIYVKWDEPSLTNGEILKYRIFYTEEDDGSELYHDSTTLEAVLSELRPYTEYTIYVVPFNKNGMGDASNEIKVKTLSSIPSEPPNNVTLEVTSSTTITVHWEPPDEEDRNGQITGYKIRYRKMKEPPQAHSTPGNIRYFELSGLDRHSEYQVKIAAMTVNGSGPFTEWNRVMTLENDLDETQVPGKPVWIRIVPGAENIALHWGPPPQHEIKIRSYVLGWGRGIPDEHIIELKESERHYVLKNLEANTEYVVSLRARNVKGDGPPIYDNIKTRDEDPIDMPVKLEMPVGLRAITMSSSSIVVYWIDTTLNKNQHVTDNRHYTVRYFIVGSSNPNRHRYHNTTDLNCMISDLRPNTQYEFAVKVVKGRRESDWSMSVLNTTYQNVPITPPRELTVRVDELNSQNVILQWLPPKHSLAPITGYNIYYTTNTTKRDRDWSIEAFAGEETMMMLPNLKPYTTYYFKVQARSSKANSNAPFSPLVSFTTAGNVITHEPNTLGGAFSNDMLPYIAIAAGVIVLVIIIVSVSLFMCLKKPQSSPEHKQKSYQKNSIGVPKPPDLWIHHDQMELKNIDKGVHTSAQAFGDGASSSGALTLPRSVVHEYDADSNVPSHVTNSLDKRSYVQGHMTTSMNSTMERPQYPRTQYNTPANRSHMTVDTGLSQQSLSQPQNNSLAQTPEHPYGYEGNFANPGYPNGGPNVPGGGAGVSTIESAKRGHPLKSFSVPGPPPTGSSTPINKHPSTVIRPQNQSPYKKPSFSGSTPNRLQGGASVAHSTDEIQRLAPSTSTEELNQEMANLEGLMKDLSAITANEFEC